MIESINKLGNQLQKLIRETPSEKINLVNYLFLVKQYNGRDWKQFVTINKKTYQRTKVYECEFFDIFIITWDHNQESKIHNHASQGCINKVLKGELIETIYDTNTLEKITHNKNSINHINYIDDTIGYHKIQNKNNLSVSLHIYSPPHFKTKYF